MTATATPDIPQTTVPFTRATFDVQSAGERSTVTGYRCVAGDGTWGISRYGSTGKTWAVWHVPTGLLVRAQLPTLDAAKSLCTALEQNPASRGQNLRELAALPFGEVPRRDTAAHEEALRVWDVLRDWLRVNP